VLIAFSPGQKRAAGTRRYGVRLKSAASRQSSFIIVSYYIIRPPKSTVAQAGEGYGNWASRIPGGGRRGQFRRHVELAEQHSSSSSSPLHIAPACSCSKRAQVDDNANFSPSAAFTVEASTTARPGDRSAKRRCRVGGSIPPPIVANFAETSSRREGRPKPPGQRIAFTIWKHYSADSPLLESGLLGPVMLRLARLIPLG